MVKKAIDSRIPTLIRNGAQERKRSFFVIVGDRQKDVVVNLYHILLNVDLKLNKSVLWAYKHKLLGFSSHRKKREKRIRKEIKRGIRDVDAEDPFELFVATQDIRYVYYKETDKILGNTYGMCILQDFEAITPNLLARTVETVEGGGLVLLLLKGMKSLKQLFTLSMDIHSRYRTEAHGEVVSRFNERFILSLGSCESCLVIDDEMNVLPISGGKSVGRVSTSHSNTNAGSDTILELEKVKANVGVSKPVGPLIALAKTVNQAQALLTFIDAIAEKTLQSTVALTAARGRGKSAALGVAVAAAVAHGYSNIFITSPSPENLGTLFRFIIKGFDALEYLDHVDYTIVQSTNPDFNKAIVRVNIHRQHRQTIQYIQPQDAYALGQAELVVIDEAAAIPLPLVRKLLGPYLVFMASTVNGYEGTGRSLSLKLIQQLREQSSSSTRPYSGTDASNGSVGSGVNQGPSASHLGRSLREINLLEPIRYAPGDAVERWLNTLLCLDVTLPRSPWGLRNCPHPSECQLLHVNRDTLFSFHPVSEKFLQQMMTLYVASHYKNSPNDLQLMSDAPAHHLFVLVPPVDEQANRLPEPLCVIQVALEGQISRESVLNSLSRGQRAGGDLIPWLVSQQFQDEEFAGLSGARIVRIATNPDYLSMGYGSQAVKLLLDFYEGKMDSLSEIEVSYQEQIVRVTDEELENATLLEDNVKVRDISSMPPLFTRVSESKAPRLDYMGVSYGLTSPLLKFWKRASFVPIYVRQTPNDLTGEHTCVMLRALTESGTDPSWLAAFARDFHRRFLSLLSYQFRIFPSILALSIDESVSAALERDDSIQPDSFSKRDLDALFSPFDLKRLDGYANNMLDYHVILDMLPTVAQLYFNRRIKPAITLSGVQASLLLAIGLQRKTLEDLEKELNLASSQLLAVFIKVIRKFSMYFRNLVKETVEKTLPTLSGTTKGTESPDINVTREPALQLSDKDADENSEEVKSSTNVAKDEGIRSMINSLHLERYEIVKDASEWEDAERQIQAAQAHGGKSTTVSVKSGKVTHVKRKAGALEETYKEAAAHREQKLKRGQRKQR